MKISDVLNKLNFTQEKMEKFVELVREADKTKELISLTRFLKEESKDILDEEIYKKLLYTIREKIDNNDLELKESDDGDEKISPPVVPNPIPGPIPDPIVPRPEPEPEEEKPEPEEPVVPNPIEPDPEPEPDEEPRPVPEPVIDPNISDPDPVEKIKEAEVPKSNVLKKDGEPESDEEKDKLAPDEEIKKDDGGKDVKKKKDKKDPVETDKLQQHGADPDDVDNSIGGYKPDAMKAKKEDEEKDPLDVMLERLEKLENLVSSLVSEGKKDEEDEDDEEEKDKKDDEEEVDEKKCMKKEDINVKEEDDDRYQGGYAQGYNDALTKKETMAVADTNASEFAIGYRDGWNSAISDMEDQDRVEKNIDMPGLENSYDEGVKQGYEDGINNIPKAKLDESAKEFRDGYRQGYHNAEKELKEAIVKFDTILLLTPELKEKVEKVLTDLTNDDLCKDEFIEWFNNTSEEIKNTFCKEDYDFIIKHIIKEANCVFEEKIEFYQETPITEDEEKEIIEEYTKDLCELDQDRIKEFINDNKDKTINEVEEGVLKLVDEMKKFYKEEKEKEEKELSEGTKELLELGFISEKYIK